jgi:hypothetical protein
MGRFTTSEEYPTGVVKDGKLYTSTACATMLNTLNAELHSIRELLAAQDKTCLGTRYPANINSCPPWPIVDEVIAGITKALGD